MDFIRWMYGHKRERKMCSVKMRNDVQSRTDPAPVRNHSISLILLGQDTRPTPVGRALPKLWVSPDLQINLHLDSSTIPSSCLGPLWWSFNLTLATNHSPCFLEFIWCPNFSKWACVIILLFQYWSLTLELLCLRAWGWVSNIPIP